MPTVTKQTVRPGANGPRGAAVADRIQALAASKIERLKVSIYGNPKSGKTRLACTFPKPLLIIGTEDGTASVVGTKGVEFVQLTHCAELAELVQGPCREGRWRTIVLDNGTKLRDMRISEILGLDRVVLQKGWGFATRDQWIENSNSLKGLLSPLLDLPRLVPVNVVIIAQEQEFNSERGIVTDVSKPMIGSALGESVCRFVNAECDYLCQCFIRRQTAQKTTKVAGKEVVQEAATGRMEFCLRVGPHDLYWTGFRQYVGAPELPDVVVDPSYDKIVKLIQGK